MIDLSRAARRLWASQHRRKGKQLARDYLYVFAPLIVTLGVLSFTKNLKAAEETLFVIALTVVVLIVLVPLVEWLWLVMVSSRLGLRDTALASLDQEVKRLEEMIPPSDLIDVRVKIDAGRPLKPVKTSVWLATFPTYVVNNMKMGNAILRFELFGTINGSPLVTDNSLFTEWQKRNLESVRYCLANPKDAPAGGNWGDPLGFLIRYPLGNKPPAPTIDDPSVIVTEEHSGRRYVLKIPGQFNLADDSHILI